MTTIVLNQLAVEIEGEGPAVLCIHGLGGSSNNWTPVLGSFESMKVIRVDLPGSARSPLAQTPLSIDLFVATLVELLDQLAIARAHLVAHSLGTIVAQHLAVKYPQRVASLALLGPLVAPPEPEPAVVRVMTYDRGQFEEWTLAAGDGACPAPPPGWCARKRAPTGCPPGAPRARR